MGIRDHRCSTPFNLDDPHLGKVLPREETDKDSIRIDDGEGRSLGSLEPFQHAHQGGIASDGLDGSTDKRRNWRLAIVVL